jgi:hypothetical protein
MQLEDWRLEERERELQAQLADDVTAAEKEAMMEELRVLNKQRVAVRENMLVVRCLHTLLPGSIAVLVLARVRSLSPSLSLLACHRLCMSVVQEKLELRKMAEERLAEEEVCPVAP